MVNCIIFYGNSDITVGPKTAGPFRIATELRKHGFSVICIDITAFDGMDDNFKEIYSSLVSSETLWTGFSGTFMRDIFGKPSLLPLGSKRFLDKDPNHFDKGVQEFVDFAKRLNPKMKLLLGGARLHRLSSLGFITFEKYVDKEIVDYTKWLAKQSTKINLQFYTDTIVGEEFKEFSSSQILYEENDIIFKTDTLPLEVSRGCIFKCKFCSYPLNGKKKGDWIKQAKLLREELILNYEKFGVTNYALTDDTYNDSVDKLLLLYDEVWSKVPFKIKFSTYTGLDLIVRFPEMVDILKESGLKSAVCGLESINPKSAKSIGKGLDPQIQIEFARELKKDKWKDILISSNFILGLPHDTRETIDEFEEWVLGDKNPFDYWYIFPLGIFPPGSNKSYTQSEFDLNYKDYGYELIRGPDDPDYLYIGWKNDRTKLNAPYCNSKSKLILDRSRKTNWKFGGWLWSIMQEFIPDEDITRLSRNECYKKYNLDKLREEKKKLYIKRLYKVVENIKNSK